MYKICKNCALIFHFSYNLDCGWQSDLSHFTHITEWRYTEVDIVIPLFVPEGYTFQHFMDGVLPKIMQAYDIIMQPGVRIALSEPQDTIIFDILHKLNITCDKIIFTNKVLSRIQINSCIAPPLHPTLWKGFRHLLGVSEHNHLNITESNIILLTRADSYNLGRTMLNYNKVRSALKKIYGKRLVIFRGGYNLSQSMNIFSKAGIIIGVHGGAFYNINFSPKDAHIIEIWPTRDGYKPVRHIAHSIFWLMSSIIGQTYWRLHEPARDEWGDVYVNVPKLIKTLEVIDNLNDLNTTQANTHKNT